MTDLKLYYIKRSILESNLELQKKYGGKILPVQYNLIDENGKPVQSLVALAVIGSYDDNSRDAIKHLLKEAGKEKKEKKPHPTSTRPYDQSFKGFFVGPVVGQKVGKNPYVLGNSFGVVAGYDFGKTLAGLKLGFAKGSSDSLDNEKFEGGVLTGHRDFKSHTNTNQYSIDAIIGRAIANTVDAYLSAGVDINHSSVDETIITDIKGTTRDNRDVDYRSSSNTEINPSVGGGFIVKIPKTDIHVLVGGKYGLNKEDAKVLFGINYKF